MARQISRKGKPTKKKGKSATKRIFARMKKGYNLGKIKGKRDDWHVR